MPDLSPESLAAALEAVEWRGAVNGDPACPMCGQWAEPLGDSEHDPDCQLRAALGGSNG